MSYGNFPWMIQEGLGQPVSSLSQTSKLAMGGGGLGGLLGTFGGALGPVGAALGIVSSVLGAISASKAEKERRRREREALLAQGRLEAAKALSEPWDVPRYGEGRY